MTERELFESAVGLADPAERAAFLGRECGADAALRRRVESLLRSHDAAGSFLAQPLVETADADHAATRAYVGPTPAAPADVLPFLAPGTRPDSLGRVGHYEVLQHVGRGAFGIVFRAFDDTLQRVVAVKVLAPEMAATSPARKRFLREARTSAQVRHENVVQVYEVGEQPLPYLVMEFIPGETLQQRLDRTGPVDPAEVVRVGRQIAEGLAAAHATDLIHRDIKPGNILIEGGPQRVRITDFGLARAADDASASQSGVVAGTPMYMAPEQALGQTIDQRADLFSLGSVLYQMVTGRPPFRANTTLAVLKRVVEDAPRPIREVIPETPRWLCDIVQRLHEKKPADRFQSAREVADLLAECEARMKANARTREFPLVVRRRPKRVGWWAGGAVAVAALVGLVVYAATRPDPGGRGVAQAPPLPAAAPAVPVAPPNLDADRRAAVYVLSIGGSVRVNGSDELLATVEQLPKTPFALTAVCLRDNPKVTDEGLSFFRGCRNVQWLDLAVTKVTDAGLANFQECAQLSTLDLFSTTVGDTGLAHFKHCKLTYLSLRSTAVTDATAAALAHCTDLENLGLAHTQVTAAGVAHFRNCKKIKHLDLDALPVGDADLAHFDRCKNLEVLHLGGTRVTDPGVAWLKGCEKLRFLLVRGTPVTAEVVRGLKAALPLCRIEWNGGVVEPPPPPFGDADARRISALPATEQIEAVRAELRKRNPTFDGVLTPTVESGEVVGLELSTLEVADITPLRALTKLKSLALVGQEGNGKLADLTPLKGLPLATLDCNNNPVADLAPLKGMPLKGLYFQHTKVADLAPLAEMPLEQVNASHTTVADLTPLKGMPLTAVYLDGTKVTDLTPLKGTPLKRVNLRGLSLKPDRDGAVLRSLDTLEEVNGESPSEYLMKLDGGGGE